MKRINFLLLLLALVSASAVAQTRPAPTATPRPSAPAAAPGTPVVVPQAKIAFVDTESFGDEASGIKKFTNAVKSVQAEFKDRTAELLNIQNRLKLISEDITKLSAGSAVVTRDTIQAKQDEGEKLERDFKYKKDQLDADFQKRYAVVVQPVSSDIGKALDQYLNSHGLTMILDMSKLAPAVLSVNPSMDITKDFVAEYNSKNP